MTGRICVAKDSSDRCVCVCVCVRVVVVVCLADDGERFSGRRMAMSPVKCCMYSPLLYFLEDTARLPD